MGEQQEKPFTPEQVIEHLRISGFFNEFDSEHRGSLEGVTGELVQGLFRIPLSALPAAPATNETLTSFSARVLEYVESEFDRSESILFGLKFKITSILAPEGTTLDPNSQPMKREIIPFFFSICDETIAWRHGISPELYKAMEQIDPFDQAIKKSIDDVKNAAKAEGFLGDFEGRKDPGKPN